VGEDEQRKTVGFDRWGREKHSYKWVAAGGAAGFGGHVGVIVGGVNSTEYPLF
jgi:hypothetical protein